jgi:hypothetical protein
MAEEEKKPGQNVVPRQDQPTEKSDDELTLGEFIDRHLNTADGWKVVGYDEETGKPKTERIKEHKQDMNVNQVAERLGLDSREVLEIARELGHKLPEGAN